MESNNLTIKGLTLLALLMLIPLTACGKGNDKGGRPQGPPPEAIEACEGQASGDVVTFKGRRGDSVKATCQEIEGQLVAVPEGMEPGDRPPK